MSEESLANEKANYWLEKKRPCKLRNAVRRQQCGGTLRKMEASKRHELTKIRGEAVRLARSQAKSRLRGSPEATKLRKAKRRQQRLARRQQR